MGVDFPVQKACHIILFCLHPHIATFVRVRCSLLYICSISRSKSIRFLESFDIFVLASGNGASHCFFAVILFGDVLKVVFVLQFGSCEFDIFGNFTSLKS